MAVVGQEVLSNVLGPSRVDPAVTINSICLYILFGLQFQLDYMKTTLSKPLLMVE